MSNKISEEKIQEIIEAYQNGMPPKEICKKFDFTKNKLHYLLTKN